VCYFHLNDELESLTGQICLLSLDGKEGHTQMLNGTIPSEIGNLRSLKELWLCKFFTSCFCLLVKMNLTSQQSSHTHTIDRSN